MQSYLYAYADAHEMLMQMLLELGRPPALHLFLWCMQLGHPQRFIYFSGAQGHRPGFVQGVICR